MRLTLISRKNSVWRNALGFVAAAALLPVVIVVKLLTLPFERPVDRTPEEVVKYLRDFIEGTGGDWDYDDFESIPIADPRLEAIRHEAAQVREPMTEEGLSALQQLLARAERIKAEDEIA